jgi:hypothetical protein
MGILCVLSASAVNEWMMHRGYAEVAESDMGSLCALCVSAVKS